MVKGEVYVVVDAVGLVKVGFSVWSKRRFYGIWSNNKPLRIVAVKEFEERMARSVEKLAHHLLGSPVSHPFSSEWFEATPKEAVMAVHLAARRVRRYRKENGTIEKSWTNVRDWWERKHRR